MVLPYPHPLYHTNRNTPNMESLRHELQGQKIYDFLQSGGHGAAATIEFIMGSMRSFDDDYHHVHHPHHPHHPPHHPLQHHPHPHQPIGSGSGSLHAHGHGHPHTHHPPHPPPPPPHPSQHHQSQSQQQQQQQQQQQHQSHHPPPPPPAPSPHEQPRTAATAASTSASAAPATLELDPNIVLQNFVSEIGDAGRGRPHSCNVCQASYKTRTHLRRHMMIHLNNRPYPCQDCGKGFNRKEHLNKHIEAVHSGRKHRCEICGKEISRRDHLSRHIKNIHPAYAALMNKEDLPNQDHGAVLKVTLPNREKHKVRSFHVQNKKENFKGKKGDNGRGQGQQQQQQHGGGGGGSGVSQKSDAVKREDARKRAEEFRQGQSLDSNSYQQVFAGGNLSTLPPSGEHTPSTSASFNSNVAISPSSTASSISTASSPQKHSSRSDSMDSTNRQNGIVGLTNLSLTLGGQMREAPFSHSHKHKREFPCTDCPETFISEKEVTVHSRSHKPQNFPCSECSRAYTRREKLTEHIRCFHQGQKFKCEHCGKELSRKDHVLRHVRSIHPELLASRLNAVAELHENLAVPIPLHDNERNPQKSSSSSSMTEMGVLLRSICQYCLKVFGTSYHLSRHIESCHNGDVRPYSCNSCSKQFKRKDHLTKHVKAHCPNVRDLRDAAAVAKPSSSSPRPKPSVSFNGQSKSSTSTQNKVKQEEKKKVKNFNYMRQQESQSPMLAKGDTKVFKNKLESRSQNLPSLSNDDIEMKDSEESDFNLAMINSFIAENGNVGVEEDLTSLLNHSSNPHHSQSGEMESLATLNSCSSTSNESRNTSSSIDKLEEMPNCRARSNTAPFCCGHCQKEFPERKELLEHLEVHDNEGGNSSDGNPMGLKNIQFSNF